MTTILRITFWFHQILLGETIVKILFFPSSVFYLDRYFIAKDLFKSIFFYSR